MTEKSNKKLFYINSEHANAKKLFKDTLSLLLTDKKKYDKTIILCIGSDRATGDCLGPLCGHKLANSKKIYDFKLYGTLNNPVHAKNLTQVVENIYTTYKNPFIIAVDACLGKENHIGHIMVKESPLNPGAALNQGLPKVGDISISGIVNEFCGLDPRIISSTRLNIVMKLADIVSEGLEELFCKNTVY